jgi:plastocyanin
MRTFVRLNLTSRDASKRKTTHKTDSAEISERKRTFVLEQLMTGIGQNNTTVKTTKLLLTAIVSGGLAFGVAAQAKEHEEENINTSDVPAEVQKAAETEAHGGKIVRWEKEGANYEAVIEKKGKKWGVQIDANGKVLGKHDESKEKSEKHEKN